MSQTHLEDMQYTQLVLFIVSIILIFLIFTFGWTQFLYFVTKRLNFTKNMLGLISIDYLFENTYIMHYINKELIKEEKAWKKIN